MTFSELGAIASFYVNAKQRVIAAGFAEEIVFQQLTKFDSLTESVFLREAAWVILCAGMSEQVIRAKFENLAAAFLYFQSSEDIATQGDQCYQRAIAVFRHHGKIRAIVRAAESVAAEGFENLKAKLSVDPFPVLERFDYIGPITVKHLAKNIGLVTAKEDRHLSRLAYSTGFNNASALCSAISRYLGDREDVVDSVLWRYATLQSKGTRKLQLDA